MRIDDFNPIKTFQKVQKPDVTGVKPDKKAGQKEDQLEISQVAKERLQGAQVPAELSSLQREERLARLREQLAAGTYHISEELVADKMLQALRKWG